MYRIYDERSKLRSLEIEIDYLGSMSTDSMMRLLQYCVAHEILTLLTISTWPGKMNEPELIRTWDKPEDSEMTGGGMGDGGMATATATERALVRPMLDR